MATYTTAKFREAGKRNPVSGINIKTVQHTLSSALANGTSDVLKVIRLPKGVTVIPELCSVGSFNDPDSGNNATVSLKYTDGTTTKTIIATGNLQAADTPLSGTAAMLYTNSFHVTDNDDYYVYLTAEANDVDSGAELAFVITYIAAGN